MNTPKMGKNASLEDCFQACSISDSSPENHPPPPPSPPTLELNSHISLPYQWEQCLDLKTGEIYYIDWSNGKKAKYYPRAWLKNRGSGSGGGDGFCYEDESCDESENGSVSSYSSSSLDYYLEDQDDVLVVAGCKRCLMYFMVPKMEPECPKCRTTLLHFNGSGKSHL